MIKIKYKLISFLLILITNINTQSQLGWTSQISGTMQNLYSISFVNHNTGFSVGNSGTILKTTNGGINWIQQYLGTNNSLYCIDFPTLNIGFIAGTGGIIIKTTNQGMNWNYYSTGLIDDPPKSMYFIDENIGFMVTYIGNKLLKTINGGVNWNISNTNIYPNFVFFLDANTGFIAGGSIQGTISKTTNSGNNWSLLNVPNTFFYNSIYFCNFNTGYSVGSYGLILKTINGGENWTSTTVNSSSLNDIIMINSDTGYTCGNSGKIFKTTNGMNWIQQQNYSTVAKLNDINFLNNTTGYAVGDYGTIIKTTTGGEPIGIEPISNNIPSEYKLHQNYPNPFNPETHINFSIPERSYVKIIIYDIQGRIIDELVNLEITPGTYSVNWNASVFSSGVYYYRMTTIQTENKKVNYAETKRMVLIK